MENLKEVIAGLMSCGRKGAEADLDSNKDTGLTLKIIKLGGDGFRDNAVICFYRRGRTMWDDQRVPGRIDCRKLINDSVSREIPEYEHLTAGDEQGREMLITMLTDEAQRLMRDNPEDFRITPRECYQYTDQEIDDVLSCRDLA